MIERGTHSLVTKPSMEELVQQAVFFGLGPVVLDVLLIWTTKQGTNVLTEPSFLARTVVWEEIVPLVYVPKEGGRSFSII